MIYQISTVPNKTQSLTSYNKGLIEARLIQARLKEMAHHASGSESGFRQASRHMPANSWFD